MIYRKGGIEKTKDWDLWYPVVDHSSQIIKPMCVSVCHGIHCQVSDRFLFVHKLHPVISSIFKTIKQQRENGWLGNLWILICQQNENESGRRKMEECRVGSGCRGAWGTNFFFFLVHTRLLSFTALPCGHDENNLLPEVWNCSKSGCDSQGDAGCASCISCNQKKIHGLQTNSVMIAPPDMGCFQSAGMRP